MKKQFLVVTNQIKSAWLDKIAQAVAPTGKVDVVSAKTAVAKIGQKKYELVIIDYAAAKNIIHLISQLHASHAKVPIVVATLTRGWKRTREALRVGAKDYILKSISKEELAFTINSLAYPVPAEPATIKKEEISVQSKATILFADNDLDFLNTRKEFLERAGYKVILAKNSVEARKKLEIGGLDLAIIDIRLENDDNDQDMSGLILASKFAREIPKIILTNFPTFEYVREVLRPQLDGLPAAIDILAKTEGATALLTTIRDILRTTNQKIKHQSKVFIVHGHDTAALGRVRSFLEEYGVKPVILFEEADRGDTIIEKMERCCREADFAIVLFTPDDFGYSKETPTDIKYRARQNVIFELGYMVARLGRRRVRVLYKQKVEIPTDFMGVLYIEMDKQEKWKNNLKRELKDTGIIKIIP